jgi:putative tryptophan/tyrosine transport system substrate-binding protein
MNRSKQAVMATKTVVVLLVGLVLASVHLAEAQQQVKVLKIGEVIFGTRPGGGMGIGRQLLRRELRQLGYIEGKSVVFEVRSAEGKVDRFPALVDELVRLKVDVILATSFGEILAAKNATKTIPIVFMTSGDPVAAGVIDSLAHPGGNLTGFTEIAGVLAGKRLELLKETVPKLSRVALLWNPVVEQGSADQWKESQLAARELGLHLHSMEVRSADKYENAFKEATKARSTALAVTQTALASATRTQIVELAAKYRLPAIYTRRDFVESGGLMSYGSDRVEPYRRAAVMIDKILKGAKPADLPVEQPTKYELVINLKTAKTLDLTIPPVVMMRAEKVIK